MHAHSHAHLEHLFFPLWNIHEGGKCHQIKTGNRSCFISYVRFLKTAISEAGGKLSAWSSRLRQPEEEIWYMTLFTARCIITLIEQICLLALWVFLFDCVCFSVICVILWLNSVKKRTYVPKWSQKRRMSAKRKWEISEKERTFRWK